MLKPGTYKLTRDVTNPKPDRRKTSDWRAKPMWPEGTQFIVKERRYDLEDAGLSAEDRAKISDEERAVIETKMITTEIHLVGSRWSHMNVRENAEAEQHAAISAALEAIEESHAAMFTRLGVPSEYFTRWLVESGRLTPSAFEKLWEVYQERENTQGPQLTSTEIEMPRMSCGCPIDAHSDTINVGMGPGTGATCGRGWPIDPAVQEWFRAPWPCGHNDPIYRGPTAQECSVCHVVRTDPGVKPAPQDRFRWLIEIEVDRVWVEDGFDVDNERALLHPAMGIHGMRQISWALRTQREVITAPVQDLSPPLAIEVLDAAKLDDKFAPPWFTGKGI